MKPIVGITPIYDPQKESYWMLPGYMKALENAGVLPVMLPMTENEDVIKNIINTVDGILFSGGCDINPMLYGETAVEKCGKSDACRDIPEKKLMEYAIVADMPMLCICRGLQLMNVVLGGSLYQDIPSQKIGALTHVQQKPYEKPIHSVTLPEGTPLQNLLKKDTLSVNSRHHQGIKVLSPMLEIMAEAPDGLIEAVYIPGNNFAWGLQWHPEHMHEVDEHSRAIFDAFAFACGKQEDDIE